VGVCIGVKYLKAREKRLLVKLVFGNLKLLLSSVNKLFGAYSWKLASKRTRRRCSPAY
jgi:hypothetical protein